MRWFKHLTAAHDDNKLGQLLRDKGLACYGWWWLLLEVVGLNIGDGDKAEITLSLRNLAMMTGLSHHNQRMILLSWLDYTEMIGLLTTCKSGDTITVKIPNLLKFRDEYSRKSGLKKRSIPVRTDIDIEQIQIQSKTPSIPQGEEVGGDEKIEEKPEKSPAKKRRMFSPPLADIWPVDGQFRPITEADLDLWRDAYPLVSVPEEIKRCYAWWISNPTKVAGRKGARRTITNWLSRRQEEADARGKSALSIPSGPPPARNVADMEDL